MNFAEMLKGAAILKAPHFLILFAATAHGLFGLEKGDCSKPLPSRENMLSEPVTNVSNLLKLATIIESEDQPEEYQDFWKASSSTTHRIASREIRFGLFCNALKPKIM
jgi:hypothetical protein